MRFSFNFNLKRLNLKVRKRTVGVTKSNSRLNFNGGFPETRFRHVALGLAKTFQDAPKTPQDAPRRLQDASKTPQDAPRSIFGCQNGCNLCQKLHPKLMLSSKNPKYVGKHCGCSGGSFFMTFGVHCAMKNQ